VDGAARLSALERQAAVLRRPGSAQTLRTWVALSRLRRGGINDTGLSDELQRRKKTRIVGHTGHGEVKRISIFSLDRIDTAPFAGCPRRALARPLAHWQARMMFGSSSGGRARLARARRFKLLDGVGGRYSFNPADKAIVFTVWASWSDQDCLGIVPGTVRSRDLWGFAYIP
jgi:hypothetical protein